MAKKELMKLQRGGRSLASNPYTGYYGNLSFERTPVQRVGLPIEDIANATETLRGRYIEGQANADVLTTLAENTEVDEADIAHKNRAVTDVRNTVGEVAARDDFERAGGRLRGAAVRFSTDQGLNLSVANKAAMNEFREQLKANANVNDEDMIHAFKNMQDQYRTTSGVKVDEGTGIATYDVS